MENKLFVGNLSWSTTSDDLKNFFSQFGTVNSAEVMMEKFTGRSRGFGFVEMSSVEEATEAANRTNGQEFMGRPLVVNVARPRTEEPPPRRRFGGNGNFGGFGRPRFGGEYGGNREFASRDGGYNEDRNYGGRSRFGGFRRHDGGYGNSQGSYGRGRGFGGFRGNYGNGGYGNGGYNGGFRPRYPRQDGDGGNGALGGNANYKGPDLPLDEE